MVAGTAVCSDVLTRKGESQNYVIYEPTRGSEVGSKVYVAKATLGEKPPSKIEVTVKVFEE